MNRLARFSLARLQYATFVFICGLIFSLTYAVHSQFPGTTADLAQFKLWLWPQTPRVLSAFLAYHLVGPEWLDTRGFCFAMTLLLWFPCVALLNSFAHALRLSDTARQFLLPCFTLIMLAHYSLPNVLYTYFIYDIPALLLYLIAVILLIDSRPPVAIMGALCVTIFVINRETIVVAVVHAFAIRIADLRAEKEHSLRSISISLLPIALATIGTVAMREALVWALNGDASAMINGQNLYDTIGMGDGKTGIRLFVNLRAIVLSWAHLQQLLCIGFGALIYLPVVFPNLSRRARYVVLLSVIPLVPAVTLGNLTEIRAFTEFVPLMACALATCASSLASGFQATAKQK